MAKKNKNTKRRTPRVAGHPGPYALPREDPEEFRGPSRPKPDHDLVRKLLKKLSKDSLVAHDPKRHIVIAAIRCVDAVSSTALHGDLMAMMGHYSKRDPVPDPQPPAYEDPNDPYDFPPPPERATRRILRRTADGDEVLDRSPDSHDSVSDGVPNDDEFDESIQ